MFLLNFNPILGGIPLTPLHYLLRARFFFSFLYMMLILYTALHVVIKVIISEAIKKQKAQHSYKKWSFCQNFRLYIRKDYNFVQGVNTFSCLNN